MMDTAFQHLTDEMKKFSFYVSLFPGSFGENVHIYRHQKDSSALLEELVGRSLIERFYHSSGVRYRLHKLIKDYFNQELQKLPHHMEFENSFMK